MENGSIIATARNDIVQSMCPCFIVLIALQKKKKMNWGIAFVRTSISVEVGVFLTCYIHQQNFFKNIFVITIITVITVTVISVVTIGIGSAITLDVIAVRGRHFLFVHEMFAFTRWCNLFQISLCNEMLCIIKIIFYHVSSCIYFQHKGVHVTFLYHLVITFSLFLNIAIKLEI